tara:strand:+ start:1898 stop:3487 length:1590 start_codon:yes stop_codon:yes gene_type:complete
MAAIVSNNFRVLNAQNFKEDIAGSSVYVSIGKSDVWSLTTSDTTDTTPFTPDDHLDEIGEARFNMIGMKKINSADIAHVVPRHTWASGRSYVEWDSNDADIFDKAFYVVTSEFKVYKCIKAGGGASSIQPTQTLTDPTAESDGYTWKYMYTISVADSEKFLTNSFMPTKTIPLETVSTTAAATSSSTKIILSAVNDNILVGQTIYTGGTGGSALSTVASIEGSQITAAGNVTVANNTQLTFAFLNNAAAEANLSESDYAQYLNQTASKASATAQGIERIEVTNNGTANYSSAPTVTITGDGTGATATAVMSGSGSTQQVASITVNNKGTDYTVADITFSSGDAAARAVLAPKDGHGVNPKEELGAFFIAVNSQLIGNDGSDLTVGNDFRQIMLIKDPFDEGTSTISTAATLNALKTLDFASGTITNYQVDELLVGGTSGAQGYVVEIDGSGSNRKIKYHQNDKTGYTPFTNGETVTGQTSTTALALKSSNATIAPEVDRSSGEVLFLENRTPINRTTTQIEDIKVIIEF